MLFFVNCSTVYNVHITTVPEGDYDIYYDKKPCGVMPAKGDTTIRFPEISYFKAPLLEVKGIDCYGCFQFSMNDSTRKIKNVRNYKIRGGRVKNCEVVFDLNKPKQETPPVPKIRTTGISSQEIKNIASSQVHYCVADLQLLQKGIKAYDYDNTEYKIMKKYVEYNMQKNGYGWDTINGDLTRRITLGLANDTANDPDSLPYAAWDLAASQKIKYIVVFYGYSLLESRGVAPTTAAASVALSTLGILIGVGTGFYTIVYPTGKDRKSVMDSYCAVFSVDSNKCLYNAKVSITSFNNSTVEDQIRGLYDKLFEKIRPFFIKEEGPARENRDK